MYITFTPTPNQASYTIRYHRPRCSTVNATQTVADTVAQSMFDAAVRNGEHVYLYDRAGDCREYNGD